MEKKNKTNTLLIIGNGFDLALGMNSTFKNFGKYRKKILKALPITEWTVIDLLLESTTHGLWGEDRDEYDMSWHSLENYLKETVLNSSLNNDFFETLGWRSSEEYSQEERVNKMAHIIEVLSRDDFIFRDTEYDLSGFVIDDNKLTDLTYSNKKEIGNLYFWYLFFLRRIDTFHENRSTSFYRYKNFSKDKSVYQLEKISADSLTSTEKHSIISDYYVPFYLIKPVLIRDLNIWEKSFVDFILERQSSVNIHGFNYDQAASKFISALLTSSETSTSVQKIQILNFNYSQWNHEKNDKITFENQLNIHGNTSNREFLNDSLSGIIMGFDYQVIYEYPDLINNLVPFTKTFRISEINTRLTKSKSNALIQKMDYEVDKIAIIGHSLSEADDSYFRSIFDAANLYSGKVVLEYWYTEYEGRDQDLSVEIENLQIVNALLIRYVKEANVPDITNKNNLLHKLLLENRLILREYDINEILSYQ